MNRMEHIPCVFGRKDMTGHEREMPRGHNHALFLGGCHLEFPSAVAIRPSLGDETKLLLSVILEKLNHYGENIQSTTAQRNF